MDRVWIWCILQKKTNPFLPTKPSLLFILPSVMTKLGAKLVTFGQLWENDSTVPSASVTWKTGTNSTTFAIPGSFLFYTEYDKRRKVYVYGTICDSSWGRGQGLGFDLQEKGGENGWTMTHLLGVSFVYLGLVGAKAIPGGCLKLKSKVVDSLWSWVDLVYSSAEKVKLVCPLCWSVSDQKAFLATQFPVFSPLKLLIIKKGPFADQMALMGQRKPVFLSFLPLPTDGASFAETLEMSTSWLLWSDDPGSRTRSVPSRYGGNRPLGEAGQMKKAVERKWQRNRKSCSAFAMCASCKDRRAASPELKKKKEEKTNDDEWTVCIKTCKSTRVSISPIRGSSPASNWRESEPSRARCNYWKRNYPLSAQSLGKNWD